MIKIPAFSLLLTLCIFCSFLFAQNSASNPCITAQQYATIEKQCAENCRIYNIHIPAQKSTLTTLLNWPLQAASSLSDCGFYSISAYADHDTASGTIRDFNCGSKTYDGHRGTDITIYPFKFYKMDNDLVEVVAAAAGTIITKSDGNFDKNCATNNLTANYIVIQHPDGSRALYFHMKSNSLTAKGIGQDVIAGEYLGIVGSSGNSSGPHLHFEVWSGSTVSTVNDPYSGSCNLLNATSWWSAQKPYNDPAILKASVHTTDIIIPACPDTETLNEATSFTIPFQGVGLPAGSAKFYIFMRHETSGLTADLSILNPDGTTFNSWSHNSSGNYTSSFKGFTKALPVIAGTYTFRAAYNGTTCSSTFEIINPISTVVKKASFSFKFYPNPSSGRLAVEFENGNVSMAVIEIFNVLGEITFHSEISAPKSEFVLNVPGGMCYYQLKDGSRLIFSGKLVVDSH